ncbi:MAG: hypothetical protein IJK81_13315 [Selenomonadaceae bacterium]|nr:hypothetical protein [Selenomonadaceae bacterium]
MDGFYVNPAAYTIIIPAENGFHVNPAAYTIIIPAENGFHVNPAAYTIIIPAENGFHVKPEAYAVIGERQPVLRVTFSQNSQDFILPFTTSAESPAFVIRWNDINWYNPLVSPTSDKASAVLVTYGGETFALSLGD